MTVSAWVIGSLNIDMVVRSEVLPREGETSLAHSRTEGFGGKGANQAVCLARLGARVRMFGAVGTDAYARALRQNLADCGVDGSGVVEIKGPSGLAIVHVDDNGDNTIVVDAGSNLEFDGVGEVESDESVDLALVQMEMADEAVAAAVRRARRHAGIVVLNAAPARPIPPDALEMVDVIVVNKSEAHSLSGLSDPLAAARWLMTQVRRAAVVTLGGEGSLWCDAGETVRETVVPVPVVDTTGAGDSFVAALALGLAQKRSPKEALSMASEVAAYTIGRVGAQIPFPVEERFPLRDY